MAGVNPASPAEVLLVRRTAENMVRAGELVPCGREKAAGERVWRTVYEIAAIDLVSTAAPCVAQQLDALEAVTRTWAAFD